MIVKTKTPLREKRKLPISTMEPVPPGTFSAIIEKAKQRGSGRMGIEDLFIRKDCPCPNLDCPHRGNCAVCIMYHHMLQAIDAGGDLIPRMVIPSCTYFSVRDYWMKKRNSTNSPEVKEAIDEWLAYQQDIFNLRRNMTHDTTFMKEFDELFEDYVTEIFTETYRGKTREQRAKRLAENKRIDEQLPGVYPYK